MSTSSPHDENLRRAHPLARALVERLQRSPHANVLDFGSGSGRNTRVLSEAGHRVHAVPDDQVLRGVLARNAFDGAISTHALLHGRREQIAAMLSVLANALKPRAPFNATFASKTDARFGKGTHVADDTFAPETGSERGVPHTYFDEAGVRALLRTHFLIESLEERAVDEIAGSWAHQVRPQGSVHWFVRALRR